MKSKKTIKKTASAAAERLKKIAASVFSAIKAFAERRRVFEKGLSKPERLLLKTGRTVAAVALAFILVMYGPVKTLSDLYITTAMRSSDHKYLATMLYSDKYISKVLERNSAVGMEGVSEYTPSEYIGSDKIELTRLEGYGCSGYLITVYDESRIDIVEARGGKGELLESIAERSNAAAAINASGYASADERSIPNGLAVYDGKAVGDKSNQQRSFVAVDYENRLFMGTLSTKEILSAGFRDAVEFGPLLILNGEPCEIKGNGGGLAPRTAMGITADRRVLLLVLEGREGLDFGANLRTVQEIMLENGAVNACNLDGGFSSSMYYDEELIMNAGSFRERMLPNAVIVEER